MKKTPFLEALKIATDRGWGNRDWVGEWKIAKRAMNAVIKDNELWQKYYRGEVPPKEMLRLLQVGNEAETRFVADFVAICREFGLEVEV